MLVQLQYLRAIAAMMVVYFHTILLFHRYDPGSVLEAFKFGKSGVDIFFVVSGFVMWLTTAGRSMGPVEFWIKRLRRILPVYWTFTLLAAAVALVAPSLLKSTVFDLPHLLASLVFIPWHNPADPTGEMVMPVVIPGWTLNYEMFFYFVFGLMLLLAERLRQHALALFFGLLVAAIALLPIETTATTFYGRPIVLEFVAGVYLAVLHSKGVRIPPSIAVMILPAAFLALLRFDHAPDSTIQTIGLGVSAALVVASTISMDIPSGAAMHWLKRIGDGSYSLYISHVFVLPVFGLLYNYDPSGLLRIEAIFVPACIVSAILVGMAVHIVFEAPVDHALGRWLARKGPAKPEPAAEMARHA